jgi:hypothetical protein
MNNQTKIFPVFNKQIADALILKGFKLIDKSINRKFPKYSVFYFEATKKFNVAFYEESVLHKGKK